MLIILGVKICWRVRTRTTWIASEIIKPQPIDYEGLCPNLHDGWSPKGGRTRRQRLFRERPEWMGQSFRNLSLHQMTSQNRWRTGKCVIHIHFTKWVQSHITRYRIRYRECRLPMVKKYCTPRSCFTSLRGYHTERRTLANVANFGFSNFSDECWRKSGLASVISDF